MLFLLVSWLLTFTHTGSHQSYCVVESDGSYAMLYASSKVDAILTFYHITREFPGYTWECSI